MPAASAPEKEYPMARPGHVLAQFTLCVALSVMVTILLDPATAQADGVAPPWDGGWRTAVRRDHPDVGHLRQSKDDETLTPDAAVQTLAPANVVLIGEKHDNPDHHHAQAWLLRALVEAGRHPAVVMEMLDTTQAETLAAYLAQDDATAASLGQAVGWETSGWPDWALYQPIAEVALAAGLPILPGNLPTAEVRRIAREGSATVLGADGLSPRGLDRPFPDAARASLSEEILAGHCGMLPEQAVPSMIRAQRARDGEMARALLAAAARPDTDGAVLIAGNGHVRRDRGVPWVLGQLAPDVSVATVGLLEVPAPASDSDAPDEATTPPPFDIVWWTPAVDDEDPCETFAAQLERMRARQTETSETPETPAPPDP